MRLAVRRIEASLIDWACILGWVGLTAGAGLPLYRAGLLRQAKPLQLNVVAALSVVLPVVLTAAILESREAAATPGKRALGLAVRTAGGRPAFPTALWRNTLKIGIPWLVGHAVAFSFANAGDRSREVPARVWVLTAAAYALPAISVASLFAGDGRTLYDRITGTRVILRPGRRSPGRRAAPRSC